MQPTKIILIIIEHDKPKGLRMSEIVSDNEITIEERRKS